MPLPTQRGGKEKGGYCTFGNATSYTAEGKREGEKDKESVREVGRREIQ